MASSPQEQIEDVARQLDALARSQLDESNNFLGDREQGLFDAYDHAEQLVRAIKFDSPQISEGMVEAGAKALFDRDKAEQHRKAGTGPNAMYLSESYGDTEWITLMFRQQARACLSAALTQKGDSK